MLNQARTLFQNHQLDDSLQLCRQLVAQQADNIGAQVLQCAVLFLRSESTLERIEAQGLLEKFKSLDEKGLDAAISADLAAAYLLSGQAQAAENCLRLSLENGDHSAKLDALLWARLGMVLMQQGLFDEALSASRRSLSFDANNPVLRMNEARLLARLGDADGCLTLLRQLPFPQPDSHPALLEGRIEILFLCDKKLEAEQLIGDLLSAEKKIEADSDEQAKKYYLKLLNVRASFCVANEHYADAEMYLRQGLELKGDNRELVRALADLCDLQGRYTETASLLLTLSRHYEDEPTILLGLANAYIQLQQMEHALTAVKQAEKSGKGLALKSLDAQVLTLRARIEQEKDTSSALESYQQALALDDHCLQARQGLGHLYLLLGRTEEAIEQFNLVSDRSLVAGFSSLVSVREYPKDDATLAQLEASALLPVWAGASGIHAQIRLLFSLAATREANKDYGAAFKWALEANRKVKQNLKWDNAETRDLTQRLIHTFSHRFYAQHKAYGSDSNVPVFVLGMPRSGTTLMEQMLGNHSALYAAGELGLVSSRVHSIKRWEQHIGSGQTYPECVAHLSANDVLAMADQHVESLRDLVNERGNDSVAHIIDKLPHNFQHIGLIHLLFPKAKIIYCRRDAKAIALSNFFTHYQAAHQGMGFAYSLDDLGEHIADHQIIMRHWFSTLPQHAICAVDYEAVVDDPEQQMRPLIKWLGLEWEDSILKHTELKRSVKTASVWQVRQPMYKSSKQKWRHYENGLKPFDDALKAATQLWQSADEAVDPEHSGDLNAHFAKVFDAAIEQHHKGQLQQAEAGYRQVLAHNATHQGARYLLAGIAYQTGHFEPALNLYQTVAQHYQQLAAFHYNCGLTLFALERYELAKKALQRALKLQKKYPEAQSLLDEILQKSSV